TLDTLVNDNGRSVVRHYLQDIGSTFGTGANGPHDFFEGWEYLFDTRPALRRLASLGFLLAPWQTVKYERQPSIGRFEAEVVQPAIVPPGTGLTTLPARRSRSAKRHGPSPAFQPHPAASPRAVST